MMRAVALAVLLTACRNQEAACREAADTLREFEQDGWFRDCVSERWSDAQIRCHLTVGRGSFRAMFCDNPK
jgi:hypothetical protein